MKELEQVLDDYRDIFMKNKADIGYTHLEQHDIEIEEGAEPPRETYRRFPAPKRDSADEQVRALLEDGLIDPSRSPYSSGVVLVKKNPTRPGDSAWTFGD